MYLLCVTSSFQKELLQGPHQNPNQACSHSRQSLWRWYKSNHSFIFRLPPGVCKASATFTGTSGIHEFQFRSGFCQAVHIPWEDMDYDYNHDYYLLARERDRLGMGDFMISDCPFQRRSSITDFYNPTHLAYLGRGAVTRGRRSYDQDEYRSPDNRYYHPPHENNISPLSQCRNTCRCQSYFRSRSDSPPLRSPPLPRPLHLQDPHHPSILPQ